MEMTITYDMPLLKALEEVKPHDHLSLIYESSEDHFAVAVPFIRIGLDRGQKCIYIADDGTEAVVRDAMHDQNIDVERAIATGKLVLETKEGAFLKHGSFDPEWMPTFWKEATAEAMRQGFSALRATGETEWVLCGAAGLERWMEYESRLTSVLGGLNCFALCQYNRQILPPEFILDVIHAHPTVVYRGVVCQNMYHVPPDEFLGTNKAAREAERLLMTIRERAEIEQRDAERTRQLTALNSDLTKEVLERQRAEEQLRRLSGELLRLQDEERRRIARELHDSTGQELVALATMLGQLRDLVPSGEQKAGRLLSECRVLANQCIGEIRTLSYVLHPPALDEDGIEDAIREYVKGFTERTRIKVELELSPRLGRMPRAIELALFRVMQESLTNVQRHSGSLQAKIQLGRHGDSVILEIIDSGRGSSETAEEHDEKIPFKLGVGIASMQERAKLVGGRLEIHQTRGGTTIRVVTPAGSLQHEEASNSDR